MPDSKSGVRVSVPRVRIPQLQAAGAQIGADAVIVRSDRSNNDRHVVVEGEAIMNSVKGTPTLVNDATAAWPIESAVSQTGASHYER